MQNWKLNHKTDSSKLYFHWPETLTVGTYCKGNDPFIVTLVTFWKVFNVFATLVFKLQDKKFNWHRRGCWDYTGKVGTGTDVEKKGHDGNTPVSSVAGFWRERVNGGQHNAFFEFRIWRTFWRNNSSWLNLFRHICTNLDLQQ